MHRSKTQTISGWGGVSPQTCQLIRPEKYKDLHPQGEPCIPRGNGRSYGDAAVNEKGHVILTERLNRFLSFDETKGILTAEAGVSLKEILDLIVPKGWFLPVTPGTQFASLGGCVATDVHGKNHHRDGSLGNHIIAFELITADNRKILCSPQNHSDLFWATMGGMGLTGIIGTVVFKLMPIPSSEMMVCHHAADDLDQTFLYLSDPAFDDHYTVAWIDTLSNGRSIVMTGHHAKPDEISFNYKRKNSRILSIPINLPSYTLNKWSIKLFNQLYFYTQSKKKQEFTTDYQKFFYPLDNIENWNRLYGKKGFVQYQCVFPENTAYEGVKKILSQKCPSFLAVLKRFGQSSKGLLSFPMPGYTLALDIPFRDKNTEEKLKLFDDIVLSLGGRVYLAKDAFLSPESFRQMYPNYPKWLDIKKKTDPHTIFQSHLSRRLMINDA